MLKQLLFLSENNYNLTLFAQTNFMKKLVFLFFTFCLIFATINFHSSYAYAKENNIEICFQSRSWKIDLDSYKVESTIHTISYESYRFERKSSKNKKVDLINKITNLGIPLKTAMNVVFHGINKDITAIIKQIDRPSINATAKLDAQNNFIYKNGVIGFKTDENKLYKDLLEAIATDSKRVFVSAENIQPDYTIDDIKNSTNLRSKFETSISSSTPERKHNIRLALSKFNGKEILPSETLSFNQTTGIRNEKSGYKQAKIIISGVYTDGFGGGVCQASTTLYNACLLAGLNCTARGHSMPASYVPKGLDAMVSNNVSDLKITNNTKLPIYIKTRVTESKALVEVYGQQLNGTTYKTKSIIVNEKEEKENEIKFSKTHNGKEIFEGDKVIARIPHNGYKTETYLQTYANGKLISEKLIRKDNYPALKGIIIYGTTPKPISENNEEILKNKVNLVDKREIETSVLNCG